MKTRPQRRRRMLLPAIAIIGVLLAGWAVPAAASSAEDGVRISSTGAERLSAGIAIDPDPPNVICDFAFDFKKKTSYYSSCVNDGSQFAQQYRSVAHCTTGPAFGPWVLAQPKAKRTASRAVCPEGISWTSAGREWRPFP